MHYFIFLVLHLAFVTIPMHGYANHFNDGFPNEFHITQDKELRLFHIYKDDLNLGTILSSAYGVLDFYNSNGKKEWVNLFDSLYDASNNQTNLMDIHSTFGFGWDSKSHIKIYTSENELLATLEPKSNTIYLLHDPETDEPLALAIWSHIRNPQHGIDRKYIQDWYVKIVNRSRLEEKHIKPIILIWSLLKHSQRFFPSPTVVNYVDGLTLLRPF